MYRTIDVNINRICEGLRIIEDYLRFDVNDVKYIKLKEIRHFIREKISTVIQKKLLENRESNYDIGKKSDKIENNRISVKDILLANFLRIQEGLRVIEEYSKIINEIKPFLSEIKSFRFIIYESEKEIILNLENAIDFSLYLSLKIKDGHCKNIIDILKNIQKIHKFSSLEIENDNNSIKEFYELSVKIKNYCSDNNISLILKNNMDIAKEINSNALIIDELYLPYNIIRKNYHKKIGLYSKDFSGSDNTETGKYDFIVINKFFDNKTDKLVNSRILYKTIKELKVTEKYFEYSFFSNIR